jgi:hypothetical protein
MSKWSIYDNDLLESLQENKEINQSELAKSIFKKHDIEFTSNQTEALAKYINRNRKRLLDEYEGTYDATNSLDVDNTSVKHMWIKNKEASLFVKNPNYVEQELTKISDLKSELIKDLQEYSPKFVKLERVKNKESYLLIIDPADIHIGKLASAFESGESYDNQIAVQRVLSGVIGILNKVSSFSIDKIVFIGGNDILHIDNPQRTTTSGTPQDTDGMWHSNFLIAKNLYTNIIEMLLPIADVHFVFNPSNHDYTNGYFLAQVIQTYFKNSENITFDCSISHRKYFTYGNNLIGTTHGDGAKVTDLPLLMAHEAVDWSKCKHRYIYTHHVHHKNSKDYMGVCVESLRSPSGTDSWHHRNGYQHAPKAVEAFLHSKDFGQIARITHIFNALLFLFLGL